MRQDLSDVTASLIAEFTGQLPAGTVIRCVARSRDDLLRAGLRSGLIVAAESLARTRLSELLPARSVARPARTAAPDEDDWKQLFDARPDLVHRLLREPLDR